MIILKYHFSKNCGWTFEGDYFETRDATITGENIADCDRQAKDVLESLKRERPMRKGDESDWSYSYK